MRTVARALTVIAGLLAVTAGAQDTAVLEVKGRGVEGKPPYRGGGVVRFLDASLGAQVVHYDGGERIRLPLAVRYEVVRPAPIVLTSRLGTEHWRLYDFGAETMTAMYADQKIDLAEPGVHTAEADKAWFGARYGPLPAAGLVGIRGHYYFLIDKPGGNWLDVTDPPPFFDQREVVRKLTFTLADLSEWSLAIPEIESTWEPGGPVRVRVTITDAGGNRLPVVNVPLTAAGGNWRTELSTQWGPLNQPSGWMRGELPDEVPETLTVEGVVTVQGPDGLQKRPLGAAFKRGDGLISAEKLKIARQGYELPRNAEGAVRETRALWVAPDDIATAEDIDELVDRCKRARLNVIVPDVFVRNTLVAKSPLMPPPSDAEGGFDPLAVLIDKAHAAGLEVHPWFCVTYRDGHFRAWFREKHKAVVDMIDPQGKVIELGADVHRPEYRDFIVDLMVGVARDYEVDGIHLDYIRSMGRCFCGACRQEYAAQSGGPLDEATDEQWIRWQRQAIGEIVRRTAEGVRRERPGAIMSAAVFASLRGGALQGQDPAGWARQGWLDVVIPMDYRMQTLEVRAHEREFLEALDEDSRLLTGLSLYMRAGGGVLSRPPELVREQIELVRRMGIHGYCLFCYRYLSDEQLRMLRDALNTEPAVPFFR